MPRHVSRSIALIIFALTSACTDSPRPSMLPDGGGGSDPKSSTVGSRVCVRLDTCKALPGSVEECTQDADVTLNSLPKNQREEVEHAFEDCLGHPSCDGFIVCMAALSDQG